MYGDVHGCIEMYNEMYEQRGCQVAESMGEQRVMAGDGRWIQLHAWIYIAEWMNTEISVITVIIK